MEMLVWNIVLTAIVALLGFVLKEKFAEINRLGILLNRTREEVLIPMLENMRQSRLKVANG